MTSEKMLVSSPPARVCLLSAPEQLLVWAFRHRAFGGADWQSASTELRSRMTVERAECLLHALDRFVVTACLRARRTLTFHRLDCHCLGTDELSLLTIVAAVQCDETGLARSTSLWLAPADAAASLIADARVVADVLTAQDWCLPLRQMQAPKIHSEDGARRLKRVLH